MKHPLLRQIVESIGEQIPDQLADAYNRSVMAGLTVMHSENMQKYVKEVLTKEGDTAENVGEGIARLTGMLINQSQGAVPLNTVMNAGSTLLMHALEFAEQTGALKVDNQAVETATESYAAYVLQMIGWTPEKLQQAMEDATNEVVRAQAEEQESHVQQAMAERGGPAGVIAQQRGGAA